ncbi:MAG: transposase, partial [Aquificota bacterium]|nr:transposase [Aquificota bacterium]
MLHEEGGAFCIGPFDTFGLEEKHKQEKKRGRPYTYPEPLIRMLLFIKFALGIPYRQTQGLAHRFLSLLGIKVPNFRTLH